MRPIELPSLRYLEECLAVEGDLLFWKRRPRCHFKRPSDWTRWNNMFAGKKAFCTLNTQGYLYGALGRKIFLTHRILWKLRSRKEPPALLDHRNGVKTNNAPHNLRAATHVENCRNRKKETKTKSGFRGVYKSHSRWLAQLGIAGKRHYLGTFSSPEKAFAARRAAEAKIYGEFAP